MLWPHSLVHTEAPRDHPHREYVFEVLPLTQAVANTEPKRGLPRFKAQSPLRADLKRAADEYFETTGLDPKGGAPMVFKSLIILTWVIVSYALLVGWATTMTQAVLLTTSLGLALSGVGFCVMHDGGHASYSHRHWLTRTAALALDWMGGSSYVWNHKHNVLHHTYTNIDGADDDIEFMPFFRLSPGQPRRWFHRFQWFYWPPLFFFLTTKWVFLDDFLALARGGVAGHKMPKPDAVDLLILFAGKLHHVWWIFIFPLAVLRVDPVAWGVCYVLLAGVWGLTMGAVFMLAHASTEAEFFPESPGESVPLPWAEHQLATTVDFGPRNPVLTWFVGGLNFQVVHHLFPRISHRHYPALAKIVDEVAAKHGVKRHEFPSMTSALISHVKFLYRMGRPDPVSA